MVSRHDTNPTSMQIAIRKAIADVNTIEIRTKLHHLDLHRLTDVLFNKIWNRHDFGPWSERWVWLDGYSNYAVVLEETDTTLTFTTLYYVRGNRKLGHSVPINLELKVENSKLNYILKVDRVGSEHDLIESRNPSIVYALSQGNLREEWIWGYEVSGFVE